MKACKRFFCAFALAAAVTTSLQAITPRFSDVPTYPDLIYATVENQPLTLDLYLPQEGPGPFPLLIWIHGGAWLAGDKYPAPWFALSLLDDGVAVASLNYRLTTDPSFTERAFPAQIFDVKGAVRFLRTYAPDYQLDPARFICWGDSAGGHLSALLGVSGGVADLEGDVGGNEGVSSRVLAAVDHFGPTCFECWGTSPPYPIPELDGALSAFFGHDWNDLIAHLSAPAPPYPDLVRLMQLAGPLNHVDPSDPPIFVAQGDADPIVPVEQSRMFVAALQKAGVPVEYHEVAGAGHDDGAMPLDLAQAFILNAFSSWHFSAGISVSPLVPSGGGRVGLEASISGGTPPYACTWNLAGSPASGPMVAKTFGPGTYTIALTVTDDTGASASAQKIIVVPPATHAVPAHPRKHQPL